MIHWKILTTMTNDIQRHQLHNGRECCTSNEPEHLRVVCNVSSHEESRVEFGFHGLRFADETN
jgi:hypothetical protein